MAILVDKKRRLAELTAITHEDGKFIVSDGTQWTGNKDTEGWEVKSSDFNAEVFKRYLVDVSSNPVTVTLPGSPSAGNLVSVKDYTGNSNTNNITIGRNGNRIEGLTSNFTIAENDRGITFIYSGSDKGWVAVYEIYGPAIYS